MPRLSISVPRSAEASADTTGPMSLILPLLLSRFQSWFIPSLYNPAWEEFAFEWLSWVCILDPRPIDSPTVLSICTKDLNTMGRLAHKTPPHGSQHDRTASGPPHPMDCQHAFTQRMQIRSLHVISPVPTANTNPNLAALIKHVPKPTEKRNIKLSLLSLSACNRMIVGIGIEKIHMSASRLVMFVKKVKAILSMHCPLVPCHHAWTGMHPNPSTSSITNIQEAIKTAVPMVNPRNRGVSKMR